MQLTFASQSGEVRKTKTTNKKKYLIYGGLAGAASRTVVAPLDRLKILNQVEHLFPGGPRYRSGVLRSLILIKQEEGLRAYWKGNGTNLLRITPVVAMRYYFNEIYKIFFSSIDKTLPFSIATQRFLSGALAGVTAAAGVYPMDLVRTRFAVQTTGPPRYRTICDAFVKIWKQERWRGFYKGIGISCLGAAPFVATEFTVYETLKDLLWKRRINTGHPGLWSFCIGAIASLCALTVAYPTDLLRKRMMIQGIGGEPPVYNGLIDACRKIWRKDGFRGFYRGLIPCYYKVIPAQAITWWVVESCRRSWGD